MTYTYICIYTDILIHMQVVSSRIWILPRLCWDLLRWLLIIKNECACGILDQQTSCFLNLLVHRHHTRQRLTVVFYASDRSSTPKPCDSPVAGRTFRRQRGMRFTAKASLDVWTKSSWKKIAGRVFVVGKADGRICFTGAGCYAFKILQVTQVASIR